MARKCFFTGKRRLRGHKISHSNRKTKCFFLPNLSNTTFVSEYLGKVTFLASQRVKRTIYNQYVSLDDYLLNSKSSNLTEEALRLRRKIRKIIKSKAATN